MNKNFKRVGALCLAGLLGTSTVMLAGCGENEEEKQKKERKKSISFAEKCKKAWDKINEMLSEPEDE